MDSERRTKRSHLWLSKDGRFHCGKTSCEPSPRGPHRQQSLRIRGVHYTGRHIRTRGQTFRISVAGKVQFSNVDGRLARAELDDHQAIYSHHGVTGMPLDWCGTDNSSNEIGSIMVALLLSGRLFGSKNRRIWSEASTVSDAELGTN